MRNHLRHAWFSLLAVAASGVIPACSESAAPADSNAGVAITISPLSLSSVVNADYRITVHTASDQVWTEEIDSIDFGNGAGAATYVGPCDASGTGINTVELELLALYDAGGLIPIGSYVNPTANGPLTQDVLCVENADRPVTFNLTIMRDAKQGFFDVAVNFDDLFCSAKVDCQAEGDVLVHDPDSGLRLPSAVVGLACTGGPAADTHLYMTDMVITCGSTLIPIPLGDGPGNLYPDGGPAPLAQGMTFTGQEQLQDEGVPLGKIYFNVALGIDFAALDPADYAAGCTLSFRAGASDGPLEDCTTPSNTTYPVMAVDQLPFITAGGAGFACTTHPLGSAAFPTTYTANDTPQSFTSEITFDDATGAMTVTACEPTFQPDHVTVDAIVYEDLNGNRQYDAGSDTPIPDATVTLVPDTTPGANLLHVLPPWQGTSDALGQVVVDDVPVMTPLCLILSAPSHEDTTQCGLSLTEPTGGDVITTSFSLRSSCVAIDTDDDTCDAIDDDCDGVIDEDADPLACDPCLSAIDCCSGVCTAGVCTGAPLPYVVASLTIDGPADLPSDYECITEVTNTLDLSPDPLNGPLPAMNFASLALAGSALFVPTSSWDVAHFPVLTTIDVVLQVYATGPDSIISVPALTTVGTEIDIYGNDLVLSFPALTSAGTVFFYDTFTNSGDNLAVSFPALTTLTNDVYIFNGLAPSVIAFPALTTVTNGVVLDPNLDPSTLYFGALTSIGDELQIMYNAPTLGTGWTDLSTFASLVSVGTLRLSGNANLTSPLGLTALDAVTFIFNVDNNPILSNCDLLSLRSSLTTKPSNYSDATGNDDVGGTCPDWHIVGP